MSQGLQFAFPVHFAFNDANVRTEDAAALDRFANVVSKHYTGAKVTVEGFADPAGSSRYNAALSKRRADAVKAYVVEQGSRRVADQRASATARAARSTRARGATSRAPS